jgi:hypothetical protein
VSGRLNIRHKAIAICGPPSELKSGQSVAPRMIGGEVLPGSLVLGQLKIENDYSVCQESFSRLITLHSQRSSS